jgi:hypothetical protein
MGYARITLTPELLITALGFPDDTRIVGADMNHSRGNVMLTVAHPDLQDVPIASSELPPTIRPQFSTVFQSVVVFLGWGQ